MKKKALFICIHNSARSQMAEAYLKHFGGDLFDAESAGLEPGKLNPFVVRAMQEDGIDISGNSTDSVFDFFRENRSYDYIVTVCDKKAAEQCPIFPGVAERYHWGFSDPSSFNGTPEEKFLFTCKVRDEIKEKIRSWVESFR